MHDPQVNHEISTGGRRSSRMGRAKPVLPTSSRKLGADEARGIWKSLALWYKCIGRGIVDQWRTNNDCLYFLV